MIYRIYSDQPGFKNITFSHSLNIILADRSPESDEKKTRNGAGKTSLIEIIHFLAGSKVNEKSIFSAKELKNYSFYMDFDLGMERIIVKRSVSDPNRIVIEGNTDTWPVKPTRDRKTGEMVITNEKWKKVLGAKMFGLGENEENTAYAPKYRSLFSYIVRRDREGGYISPTQQTQMQMVWDQQVAITYLLGLDWTIPQQWQLIREREKTLKELKKAAGQGAFGEIIGTTAELRSKLTVAEDKLRRLKTGIEEFQVLPEYRSLELEGSRISKDITKMINDNIIDTNLISELENSLNSESPPSVDDLELLYKEAGIILPEIVAKRYDDLKKFHQSIVENRKLYLINEIADVKKRIQSRNQVMEKISQRYSTIMAMLESHGAIEDYFKLRSEISRLEAETEALRQRYYAAEQLEGEKTELDIERKKLQIRLKQDYKEQSTVLQEAIITFNDLSSQLYENEMAGTLTLDDNSPNGPAFKIDIQRKESKGINNTQIFCFDLMLMILLSKRHTGSGFLIHDSHLFDPVDERQVAMALKLGALKSIEYGFQYIVTMNSDAIPNIFPDGFDFWTFVSPIKLTDKDVTGGLFGIRFDVPIA